MELLHDSLTVTAAIPGVNVGVAVGVALAKAPGVNVGVGVEVGGRVGITHSRTAGSQMPP